MNGKVQIVLGLMLLAAAGCGSSGAGADGGGHAGGGAGAGGDHVAGGGSGGSGRQRWRLAWATLPAVHPGRRDDDLGRQRQRRVWHHHGGLTGDQHVAGLHRDHRRLAHQRLRRGAHRGLYTEGPLGGTYHCKNDAGISALYIDFTYRGTVEDCTITIDNPGGPGGAHATGSFSATAIGSDGGSIEVTNGVFDTPITLSGG